MIATAVVIVAGAVILGARLLAVVIRDINKWDRP